MGREGRGMSVDVEKYMGELPMPAAEIAAETCPKCGAGEPMIRFHTGRYGNGGCSYYAPASAAGQHLHLTCRTCLHEQIRAPLDASETA